MKIVKLTFIALLLLLIGIQYSRDYSVDCIDLLKKHLIKYGGINSKNTNAYSILLDDSEKEDLDRLLSMFDSKVDRIEISDADAWSDFYTLRIILLSSGLNSIIEVIHTKEDKKQKIRISSIDFYERK